MTHGHFSLIMKLEIEKIREENWLVIKRGGRLYGARIYAEAEFHTVGVCQQRKREKFSLC